MTKAFTTSAEASASILEGAEPLTFTVDEDEFTVFPPTAGQMMMLAAAQSEGAEATDSIASIVNFFDAILDDDSRPRFRRRLMSRTDPMDHVMINQIITWLFEEWSARPTRSASGSSASPKSTGTRSKATRRSVA